MRARLKLILLGALLACGPTFKPATFVEGLRVLDLRAEPPDLAPGQSANLSALVVDPEAPRGPLTVLYLACDPDPKSLAQPACAQFSTLSDPSALAGQDLAASGIRVLGVSVLPVQKPEQGFVPYTAPAGLFDALPKDDLNRTRGVLSMILMLAVRAPPPLDDAARAELFAKIQSGEVPSALAIKRLRISEDLRPNRNPVIQSILLNGEVVPEGVRAKVQPGLPYTLEGLATPESAEHFTQVNAEGQALEKDEKPIFSWFTTAGELKTQHTESGDAEQQKFHIQWPPFGELPSDPRFTLYSVLRDGRGGATWTERLFFVCDPFLGAPTITSVTPTSGAPGTQVRIAGTNLGNLLDARFGDATLEGFSYDEKTDTVTGTVPASAAAGATTITVRGRSCGADPQVAFTVTP